MKHNIYLKRNSVDKYHLHSNTCLVDQMKRSDPPTDSDIEDEVPHTWITSFSGSWVNWVVLVLKKLKLSVCDP